MQQTLKSLILATLIFMAPLVQKSQQAHAGIIITVVAGSIWVAAGDFLEPATSYATGLGLVATTVGILLKGKGKVLLTLDESTSQKNQLAQEIFNSLPGSSEVEEEVKSVIVTAISNQLKKPRGEGDKLFIRVPKLLATLEDEGYDLPVELVKALR